MKVLARMAGAVTVVLVAAEAHAGTLPIVTACPGTDAVLVGQTCVDKYEASVWQIPSSNGPLIKKVQTGKVLLGDLTAGGATQVSPAPLINVTFALPPCDAVTPPSGTIPFPPTFPPTGNWSAPLYAVSVAGVVPTTCVTWFQAEQACALSGKRLGTNQEWQRAAAGTPDPGTDNGVTDCNIITAAVPVKAGSRANCKSNWGAFDMVGNVNEWTADWVPLSTVLFLGWTGGFSDDAMGLAGASAGADGPGAMTRGGSWIEGLQAGVFAVDAGFNPSQANVLTGFRCAR